MTACESAVCSFILVSAKAKVWDGSQTLPADYPLTKKLDLEDTWINKADCEN